MKFDTLYLLIGMPCGEDKHYQLYCLNMATSNAFQNIILNENDVPGAKFVYPEIENHTNIQLQRWLACRDLIVSGKRSVLLQRIKDCIEAGRDKDISVSVDGGKWYQLKLKGISKEQESSSQPSIFPVTGWKVFPSQDLPEHFNNGHIHHYIIESIQFIISSITTGDESDESGDIEDLHTSKPLKKGLEYFKSGHVKNLKDSVKGTTYYMKANVMASYRTDTSYSVLVSLSRTTGFVLDASCTCVASSLGRCSHIAATLFALLDYIEQFGVEKQACTSKTCEWNQGRKTKKDPKKIYDVNYASIKQRKVDNVYQFEPRPPSYLQRNESAEVVEHRLLNNIQSQGLSTSMWATLLQYNYTDYELSGEIKATLQQKCHNLLKNIAVPQGPFPVQVTNDQRTDTWKNERRVRLTASNCKAIFTAKSDHTITNLLRSKLWETEYKLETTSIAYGIEKEDQAIQQYCTNTGRQVRKCGLWVHPSSPELACSPDAIVMDTSSNDKFGILEVKCPYILKSHDVNKFMDSLSKEQMKNFCLTVNEKNLIQLKRNHSYYFQVQMQLGVMDMNWCDFFVWSSEGSFCERIVKDISFWESLKKKLVKFHHSWVCPEIFEMRIPRKLKPFYVDI